MGCGSSSHVLPAEHNGHQGQNGHNGHVPKPDHDDDHNVHKTDHDNDLPTVVLPETPAKPKPPVAFEIPLEEFDVKKVSPPEHIQRLLQPPSSEISLPDIQEKLVEAQQRREAILQQRASSAQKRTQKIMKNHEMKSFDKTHELEEMKLNTLTLPSSGHHEDKYLG